MVGDDYSSIADYADIDGDGKVSFEEYMMDEDDYDIIMGEKNYGSNDDDDDFDFDDDDYDDDDYDDDDEGDDDEGDD